MGQAFEFLWTSGRKMLSWELDFGDVSFTLWDWLIAGAVASIIIVLLRGFFSRGE